MHWSKIWHRIGFPLFILAVVSLVVVFREPLGEILGSEERLEETIASTGIGAPIVLVLVQILQVVIFVIPGEVVQIAAGYLFGVLGGAGLSAAGILLGSAANFWVGRWLGRPFIASVTNAETLRRIDDIVARRGARIGFFLLFVIPGIPKDVLCYVAGSAGTAMTFPVFLLFSMVGRFPGILGSAVIGASAAEGNVVIAGTLLIVAVILLLFGVLFQRRLEAVLHRMARVITRHRR